MGAASCGPCSSLYDCGRDKGELALVNSKSFRGDEIRKLGVRIVQEHEALAVAQGQQNAKAVMAIQLRPCSWLCGACGIGRAVEYRRAVANFPKQAGGEGDITGHLRQCRQETKSFREKYKFGKTLNSGAQGVTWLATENATGQTVVVKRPNEATDTSDFEQLRSKTHPNIVRVFEAFSNSMDTFVVMEFCEGGDLFNAISNELTLNWCAAVFVQVLKGVKYLHEQFKEAHNDIKPENILLEHKSVDVNDVPRTMVADFGCAAVHGSIGQEDGGGDPRYRAPETFRGQAFGFRTDMWSLGVTLYELVSGGLLVYVNVPNVSGWHKFQTSSNGSTNTVCTDFLNKVQSNNPPDLSPVLGSPSMGSDLPNLLSGMLDVTADARMAMDVALNHAWFRLDPDSQEAPALSDSVVQTLTKRARGKSLSVALLNLVGNALQGTSVTYYQEIWNKYDKDHSGSMELEEFKKMMHDLGLAGGPAGEPGTTVPNENSETATRKIDVKFLPEDRDLAETVFALADVEGNGTINFTEFVGLMFDSEQLNQKQKDEYFQRAFTFLAGSNKKVSLDDFRRLFHGEHTEAGQALIKQLFDDIDANHNGSIDYEEFAKYVSEM